MCSVLVWSNVRSSVFVYFEWFLRDGYGVKLLTASGFTRALVEKDAGFQSFGAWRRETAHAMDRDDWPLIED